MNPQVDDFISKATKWQAELKELRRVVLSCGLQEEFKWEQPCYTYEGSNIALIGGFKAHCALMFLQGSVLKDPQGILKKPGEHTQAGRLVPFTRVSEIREMEAVLKAYLLEAIEAEKAGVKPVFKSTAEPVPDELQTKMDEDAELKAAFKALTAGRQRGYLLHFNGSKQSATREARIEKCLPRILAGKGIHDCICGHSQKMPGCDGSHKLFKGEGPCP